MILQLERCCKMLLEFQIKLYYADRSNYNLYTYEEYLCVIE